MDEVILLFTVGLLAVIYGLQAYAIGHKMACATTAAVIVGSYSGTFLVFALLMGWDYAVQALVP